jgi:hypothetical protein
VPRRQVTADYWPPQPAAALALLAAQTTVLLTLAVLLSTPSRRWRRASSRSGLFCTTWVAGVVGGVGASLGNEAVARVGHRVADAAAHRRPVARGDARLPGPVCGLRARRGVGGGRAFPFLSVAPLTPAYLTWAAVWVAMVWALAAKSFVRKDL